MRDKRERLEFLKSEIKRHDKLYYVDSSPEISDLEYDTLLKEYESLREELGGEELGIGAVKGKKVAHSKPMLSLSNSYSAKDLDSFHTRIIKDLEIESIDYMVEEKLDGVSLSIIYEEYKLKRALTRGDGKIGEDVTEAVKRISSIPKAIDEKSIEVRGEVIMPISSFKRLNVAKAKNGERLFANPRNAASGTLRTLDYSVVSDRELDFYSYSIIKDGINSQEKALLNLVDLGFKVSPDRELCSSITKVKEFIDMFALKRKSLDYQTDGVVIKVNDFSLQEMLGYTNRSPRWAIAFKYPAQQATTVIEDIYFQVGRTGVITPVAKLKPVTLDGSTVSKCTLHNFKDIYRKDIRIGDHVFIEKSGDVIPKISSVIESRRDGLEKRVEIPSTCPSCASNLVEKGAMLFCENIECNGVLKKKLEFFVSKSAMNIEYLGPNTVEKLFDLGLIKYPEDIFKLNRESFKGIEGFEEKSISNILGSIESSKSVSYEKFLLSLGIKHLGSHGASILSKFNVEDIIKMSIEELKKLDGIGDITAEEIFKFFNNSTNIKRIESFKNIGISMQSKVKSGVLLDKIIAITGTLSIKREELISIIEKEGGNFSKTLSSKVDFLIIGSSPGSKLSKANKLGVKVINEEEFKNLLHMSF